MMMGNIKTPSKVSRGENSFMYLKNNAKLNNETYDEPLKKNFVTNKTVV